MSPDWSATVEPVPYSKLDDPQSLNLYSYVRNNPLSRFDLDGHQDAEQHCDKTPGGTVQDCETNKVLDKAEQQRAQQQHPSRWIYPTRLRKITDDLKALVKGSTFTLEAGFGGKIEATSGPVKGHVGGTFHAEYEYSVPKKGLKTTLKVEADAGAEVFGSGRSKETGYVVDDENTNIRAIPSETKTEIPGVATTPDHIEFGGSYYQGVGGGFHVSVGYSELNRLMNDLVR